MNKSVFTVYTLGYYTKMIISNPTIQPTQKAYQDTIRCYLRISSWQPPAPILCQSQRLPHQTIGHRLQPSHQFGNLVEGIEYENLHHSTKTAP